MVECAFEVVTCISVLEHVPDLDNFVNHLVRVTAPGGLLFLTMDIWGEPAHVPDKAHWHWMRKRIFSVDGWKGLAETAYLNGFRLLGDADWDYHDATLENWGYSLCSLALVKGGSSE